MKLIVCKFLITIFILFISHLFAIENIDYIIIRDAEDLPFSDDNVHCKLVFNINDIIFIENSLKKSTSMYYACGQRYYFEFVNNNRIVKSFSEQPSCDNESFLDAIKYFFPDKDDQFCMYTIDIPTTMSLEEAITKYSDSSTFIVLDKKRELKKWPALKINYRFEVKINPDNQEPAKLDSIRKCFNSRKEYLDSLAKKVFPKRAFYYQTSNKSRNEDDNYYEYGFIILRVFNSSDLTGKNIFQDIPEVVNVETNIPETYQLIYISNNLNSDKISDKINKLKGCNPREF